MSQVPGRTPFTEKDIEHLAKYLGRYSNSSIGRMGNKFYTDLVENAEGRWPWSRRHTWQSWRDQYKRNAATYDAKIEKLQVKNGWFGESVQDKTSRPAQSTGSKRKASGTAEELHNAKRSRPWSNAVAESSKSQPKQRKGGSLFTDSEDEEELQQQDRRLPSTQRRPERVEESSQEGVRAPPNRRGERKDEESTIAKAGKAGEKEKPPSTSQRPSAFTASKTAQTSTTTSNVTKPSQPTLRLLPRKKIVDEDPFISSPPAHTPPVSQPPSSSPRRQPPKYIEGPFRNTLSTGSSWPPVRQRSQAKRPTSSVAAAAPAPSAEMMPPPKIPVRANATGTPSSSRPLASPSSSSRGKRAQQHVNAMPSSSKNQLPPGPYQSIDEVIDLTQETPSSGSRAKHVKNHTSASAQSAHGSATRNPPPIKVASLNKPISASLHPQKENGDAKGQSGVSDDKKNRPSRPITASRSFPRPHDPRSREPSLHRRGSEGDAGALPSDGEGETEDVFTENKPAPQPTAKTHSSDLRRKLQIHRMSQAPIPHIDLKDVSGSAASRSRRQSSTSTTSRGSSRRGSIAPPRRDSLLPQGSRRSSSAAIRDMELFEMAGRQKLLGDLAKRYGFDSSVASGAYGRLQDLDKTQAFLSRLRDEADAAGRALLSEFLDDESDEEEGENEDERVEGGPVDELRDDAETPSISALQQPRPRRSNGPRQSLTIRPIPDEEVDKYALTVEEYSAPRRSRAGKYARQHRTHIMPYSQAPGSMLGLSPPGSQERSPPQIDLNQYSSSPLKARKSIDQESLPPSSPPREYDDEEELYEEGDDLEDKYEDLFGGMERGTSPDEVEEELFDRFNQDDDEGHDTNIGVDMDMDDNQEDRHSNRAEAEEVPETDSDTNPADGEAPDTENQKSLHPQYIFSQLNPTDRDLQRQLAHFANTVNRANKHEMAAWEAKQDPGILAAHHMLLCQIVLQKLKEGEEKPFRLDDYYDEALEDSEEE